MGILERIRRARGAPEPIQEKVRKGYVEEIKDGGVKGVFGLDQYDWGLEIGPIWRVWQCYPCCGDPPNCDDGTKCVASWYCCAPCAFAKMYAASLETPCALFPHLVFPWFCCFFALVFNRYNLRFLNDQEGNLLGDCLCILGCCPCAFIQQLRAAKVTDWKLYPVECRPVAVDLKLIQ